MPPLTREQLRQRRATKSTVISGDLIRADNGKFASGSGGAPPPTPAKSTPAQDKANAKLARDNAKANAANAKAKDKANAANAKAKDKATASQGKLKMSDRHKSEMRALQDKQRQARLKANPQQRKALVQSQIEERRALQDKQTQEKRGAKEFDVTTFPMRIYKDAFGNPRWVTFSSSGFQDRDGEFTATKALEADCERADQTGDYGPLLWWHLDGTEGNPLVKLGDCDFNMMHGHILIESGTFVSKEIGESLSQYAPALGVSLGFEHNSPRRGVGVAFNWIKKAERSLLPDFVASNEFTKFAVKGNDMEATGKISLLERLLGKKEVDELLSSADAVQKQALESGYAVKAAMTPVKPKGAGAPVANGQPDGMIDEEAQKADGALPDMGMGDGTEITDPMADPTDPDPADYVSDMTIDAFHEALDQVISDALQSKVIGPMMDSIKAAMGTADMTATKERDALTAALEVHTAALKAYKEITDKQAGRISQLETAIKELKGDLPKSILRASQSKANTITKEEVADKYGLAPQNTPAGSSQVAPIYSFIDSMMNGGSNPQGGVQ